MKKRTLIVASFLGLALAVVATVLIKTTVLNESNDSLVLVLDFVAACIAGRVILGRRRPFRYVTLAIVLFPGVAAGFFTSAVTSYLLRHAVVIGSVPAAPTRAEITSVIVGAILYLVGATFYGFAGTILGVPLLGRIGLLVLLLLAVFPGLNVIGLLGFAILSFVRRPKLRTSSADAPAKSR